MMKGPKRSDVKWRSVELYAAPLRLEASEKFERFKVEAMTEMVLRIFGILIVLSSIFLWFVMAPQASAGPDMTRGFLSAILSATGLGVFAYGSRGFRRRVKLDTAKKTLEITKLNVHETSRVSRLVTLDKVESLYVRRPNSPNGYATIFMRIVGKPMPVAVISGRQDELQKMHQEMCDMINVARPVSDEALAMAPIGATKKKPKLFASARA